MRITGFQDLFDEGATTEARNRGVKPNDIDVMNRWRNTENAQGGKPRLRTQNHYSDIQQVVPTLLRFSLAL
jgi:hypothetical protein